MPNGRAAAVSLREAADRALAEQLAASGVEGVAAVAIGAYGRGDLTPHAELQVLFVHTGDLSTRVATEVVCYPLWSRGLTVEPTVRTPAQCAAEARRSLALTMSLLDARFVAGDRGLFQQVARDVLEPLRRDRKQLRSRLLASVRHRHAAHPSATAAACPDVLAGRGGLLDVAVVRWLEPASDAPTDAAHDFLLTILAVAEDGRLTPDNQPVVADAVGLGDPSELRKVLFGHARWVAFRLDSCFATPRADRLLGSNFEVRRGRLTADALPMLEDAPSLGLRAANLVGYAPPDESVLGWASTPGLTVSWDDACREQLWLLLRAADWRAWEFLDVTGLLPRLFPGLQALWRMSSGGSCDGIALDVHSFLGVRRLHEWTDAGDAFAERLWRGVRHRDWVYLGVLLHELSRADADATARALGVPEEAASSMAFAAEHADLLSQAATQRDLHDEDLLLELAARIGSRQRLAWLALTTAAHELARSESGWSGWQADLVRQLYVRLDGLLRAGGLAGSVQRTNRSVEQHRQRISAELERRGRGDLVAHVPRLPRRYVMAHTPAFVARHLALIGSESELDQQTVHVRAHLRRRPDTWEVLLVARDRPGLLATFAGVLALRGISVLAADAATCSDGLVLDVFTVTSGYGQPLPRAVWQHIPGDLRRALEGRLPVHDLLGAPRIEPSEAGRVQVRVDNLASQFFSVVEVRAPDEAGLLYRITSGLHAAGVDIHHAKIATHPDGVLDVFYVWDLAGEKLDSQRALEVERELRTHLVSMSA